MSVAIANAASMNDIVADDATNAVATDNWTMSIPLVLDRTPGVVIAGIAFVAIIIATTIANNVDAAFYTTIVSVHRMRKYDRRIGAATFAAANVASPENTNTTAAAKAVIATDVADTDSAVAASESIDLNVDIAATAPLVCH